jgi:uncharacterized protein DUF2267
VYRDDLVSQIRAEARLRGRREAGRALAAVLAELCLLVPDTVARELAARMPADLPPAPTGVPATSAGLVSRVAARLIIDEPDAAFLCRVVFAELNAAPVGPAPAGLAPLVPAGLRPLLRARRDDPARLSRQILARFGDGHPVFPHPVEPLELPKEPVENSPGVVSIRSRAVRPVGEKVDRTG